MRQIVGLALMGTLLVAGCIAAATLSTGSAEELAKKGGQALKYGTKITLKNVYNEYLVVQPDGSARGAAFFGNDHTFKIIKSKGGKGAVNYNDKVSLQGPNGKYLMTTYSGKVVCRSSVIAADSTFKIQGGSGPVMLEDIVMLKSEFGFLHAQPGGATATDRQPNSLAKFTLGLPGQENGLHAARGIKFGDVVKFKNKDGEYLLLDRNGWFGMNGNGGDPMENVIVLSPLHREGHISFGDPLTLRGHNGRFVSTSLDGRLEAVSTSFNELAQWQFYGTLGSSSGFVHSRDMIKIKGVRGFVDTVISEDNSQVTANGRDSELAKWIILKQWEQKI